MKRSPFVRESRALRVLCIACAALALFSCTGRIGYGVMNWSMPAQSLAAGDVVPVFIQSNIAKVYVIGVGKGARTHIEVPLWQLTLHPSRSSAEKAAASLGEYRYTYAKVKVDGLVIRASPDTTAKDVYRLKLDEKIKIVRKGEGAPVVTGSGPLPGDWYEVLTDDGSDGWCFSYNLTLFDEREGDTSAAKSVATGPDTVLEGILARAWYPDLLRAMIEDKRVDIDRINPAWGFFPGSDSRIARIESADGVLSFPYTSIARQDDGSYSFVGSSLAMQARRGDTLAVTYTDANGMPQALYFASVGTTPDELIASERQRRLDVLSGIRNAGPRFSSGSYGALQFLEGGAFLWSGYQILSPTVIPVGSGAGGAVDIGGFLSDDLASAYDGVLSFRFDSTEARIHFLYNLTDQGLKLEYVSETNVKDSVVLSRNLNPIVLFFTPAKSGQGGQ